MTRRGWIASIVLFVVVLGVAAALAAWKQKSLDEAHEVAMNQPEPMEAITAAAAGQREHVRTTTAIGTVLALRSITLRNELPGTVRELALTPGQIVEDGALLIALDVAIEEAELHAQEAQAALAESSFGRLERAQKNRGTSELEVDRARAERDIANAQIARTKAIIARKTIRAPFRARIGMSDVHVGQYLDEGTELTTLQGIDDAVHVDFSVSQEVSSSLREGDSVQIVAADGDSTKDAQVIAIDSRVDRATRSAWVRVRVDGADGSLAPGASVRVRVPVGKSVTAVAVPSSALRRGPSGDHVFVIEPDAEGKLRAHVRPVHSGPPIGDEVLIFSGLSVGEQVAASGSFKLREGVLVAIVNESEPVAGGSR
jgi:membrane fusion protein (multidrug efflux system)